MMWRYTSLIYQTEHSSVEQFGVHRSSNFNQMLLGRTEKLSLYVWVGRGDWCNIVEHQQ